MRQIRTLNRSAPVLLAASLAASSSCHTSVDTTNDRTPSAALPPPSSSAATAAAPVASTTAPTSGTGTLATEYRGTIGNGLRVVARLKRDGGRVSGSYFYEKAGGTLNLAGSLIESHLALDEVTGKLKTGAIEANVASDGSLTGTWTDPSKKRSLELGLVPIARETSPDSVTVYKRTRRETTTVAHSKSKDEVCKSDVEYAEVFGLAPETEDKINARLAAGDEVLPPMPCEHAVEAHATFQVTHNGGGLLSVVVSGGLSDSAAAHPDAWESPVTVWLASGADVTLFGDIVSPSDEPAVRRELATAVHRLAHEAGADADTERLVLDSFGSAPTFVIEKQGVKVCASTPHFAANLAGCQYLVPVSRLPHLSARTAALWGK